MFWVFLLCAVILIPIIWKTDDTDISRFKRSGLSVYTDNKTGLQYLSHGMFGSLTPRLDESGKQIRK